MNPKLLRRLLVSVVVVGTFAGLYYYTHAPLLRIRLKNGTEIRVLKVAYGTGANHEHELVQQSQLKLRLLQLLPQTWQSYFNPHSTKFVQYDGPYSLSVGSVGSNRPMHVSTSAGVLRLIRFDEPMLTIWWTYDRPLETGDALHPGRKGLVTHTFGGMIFSQYYLEPGEPDLIAFHPPAGQQKTVPVHFFLDKQPVTFTVPIPAPSE